MVFKMMCARAPGLGADGVICSALWASDYRYFKARVPKLKRREGGRKKKKGKNPESWTDLPVSTRINTRMTSLLFPMLTHADSPLPG